MTDIVARLRQCRSNLPICRYDQIDTERSRRPPTKIERRLEMHPEKLHLEELAMEALADVWPCRKQ